MQEVEGWAVEGHTDYLQLKGDTGPLVYPAGFLYVYRALRYVVGDAGRSAAAIRAAQWLFSALYLIVLAVVLAIYGRARCVFLGANSGVCDSYDGSERLGGRAVKGSRKLGARRRRCCVTTGSAPPSLLRDNWFSCPSAPPL